MSNLKFALRGITWLVLCLGLGTLLAVVVIPKAMGWIPLTVLSGSMEPTYPVGSQVVVERVQGDEAANRLSVGDVITFMPEPDSPRLVTHRIVDKSWRQDGVAVFSTRGDANDSNDEWQLTGREIRGKVRYHVPYVGHVAESLGQDAKDRAIIGLAATLFGYAGWQIIAAVRGPRKRSPSRHAGATSRQSVDA